MHFREKWILIPVSGYLMRVLLMQGMKMKNKTFRLFTLLFCGEQIALI